VSIVDSKKMESVVRLKRGGERNEDAVDFPFWSSECCDKFYKRARKAFNVPFATVFTALIIGNEIKETIGILCTKDATLEEFGIEVGDVVEGVSPNGRTTSGAVSRYVRSNIKVDTIHDLRNLSEPINIIAEHYFRPNKTVTLYMIMRIVNNLTVISGVHDFLKMIHKFGYAYYVDFMTRFRQQSKNYDPAHFKAIALMQFTDNEAVELKFTSGIPLGIGLEFEFDRHFRKAIGAYFPPGVSNTTLNRLALKEVEGKFNHENLMKLLIDKAVESVREDLVDGRNEALRESIQGQMLYIIA